ncbi:hypothetical protein EKH55_4109 [Sinorhizobium alkalisoli]|nr:hypothetical protein EKH55_4109 [Sinorhizobium alkalisoli]
MCELLLAVAHRLDDQNRFSGIPARWFKDLQREKAPPLARLPTVPGEIIHFVFYLSTEIRITG